MNSALQATPEVVGGSVVFCRAEFIRPHEIGSVPLERSNEFDPTGDRWFFVGPNLFGRIRLDPCRWNGRMNSTLRKIDTMVFSAS
jgi:hypothetical protein